MFPLQIVFVLSFAISLSRLCAFRPISASVSHSMMSSSTNLNAIMWRDRISFSQNESYEPKQLRTIHSFMKNWSLGSISVAHCTRPCRRWEEILPSFAFQRLKRSHSQNSVYVPSVDFNLKDYFSIKFDFFRLLKQQNKADLCSIRDEAKSSEKESNKPNFACREKKKQRIQNNDSSPTLI